MECRVLHVYKIHIRMIAVIALLIKLQKCFMTFSRTRFFLQEQPFSPHLVFTLSYSSIFKRTTGYPTIGFQIEKVMFEISMKATSQAFEIETYAIC